MPDTYTHRQLVVFALAGEEYAFPMEQVQEIVRYTEPAPATSAPSGLRGDIALRGADIPVWDLSPALSIAGATDPTKILILKAGAGTAGAMAEHVEEVLSVPDERLDALRDQRNPLVEGVATVGSRRVTVLDARGLFNTSDVGAAA